MKKFNKFGALTVLFATAVGVRCPCGQPGMIPLLWKLLRPPY